MITHHSILRPTHTWQAREQYLAVRQRVQNLSSEECPPQPLQVPICRGRWAVREA